MKNQVINKKVDIYLTILITFFLILSLTFNYLELSNNPENYIMLTILMITALISYYLDRTTALIIALVVDFIYASIKFYLSIFSGIIIDTKVIYWVILIPVCNLIVVIVADEIKSLQKEVNSLIGEKENFSMIDKDTGFRNLSAFINEMPIYLNLFNRYKLPITLVLVKIKHGDKLKKIIGKDYYNKVLIACFEVLSESLRYEDRKYIVDKDTFAYIIISEKEGADVVKRRLKEAVTKLQVGKEKFSKDVDLQINVGTYTITEDIHDSMHFLTLAEKELEYDV